VSPVVSRKASSSRRFVLLMVAGLACRTPSTAQPAVIELEGHWNITKVAGGPLQFGLRLDRDEDGELTGVVQRILSGNMELDVSGYTRLEGHVTGERVVLTTSDAGGRQLRFVLSLKADGLRVVAIEWSGESLVASERQWRATRGS